MLQSMTGYGRASANINNKTYTVEIKSLNSKFLDINVRMLQDYRDKELEIRALFSEQLKRGKVDFNLSSEGGDASQQVSINRDLVRAYYKELESLGSELGVTQTDLFSVIFRIPSVLQEDEEDALEETWVAIKKLLHEALGKLLSFRKQEGKGIADDLTLRIKNIRAGLEEVQQLDPNRKEELRKRLNQQMEEWVGRDNIDENRFEQEMIYYLEKLDISEEKMRLASHCDYFLETMAGITDTGGKKLGFISQEIGREINTLGAKASYSPIQQVVVQMKDELEKIKEQLANVL